jgi:uncharacterized RDD family membrane protein YckC
MKSFLLSLLSGGGLFLALTLPGLAQGQNTTVDPPVDTDMGLTAALHDGRPHGHDRVQIFGSNRIGADEVIAGDAVAIMGGNTVDGVVSHDVVAIMGGNTITGTVGDKVVAIMGSVYINGHVRHQVTAVMGNVTLGPEAVIGGDVVTVGGTVHQAPGSVVRGRITNERFGFSPWQDEEGIHEARWQHPDPAHAGLPAMVVLFHRWKYALIGLGVLFNVLLALIFPEGIRRTGTALAARPGTVVLTTFLAPLALPFLFILLCVTVVGLPLALVGIPLGVFACAYFGRAAIYHLIGRGLTQGRAGPALSVLLGALLCVLAYRIPLVGILLAIGLSFLGFGCAVTALLFAVRPAAAPAAPPVPPSPASSSPPSPPAPVPLAPEPSPSITMPTTAATPPPLPWSNAVPPAAPPPPLAILPRAGFWVRMGALLIDAMIIGIFAHVWFFAIAIYAAVMWKLKGSTVGDIVFGLRVVRLDDRPLSWEAAIIRALGCFLSAAALGLGFLWIAFDPDKQAWHDKFAGTVVVRTKGVSLV